MGSNRKSLQLSILSKDKNEKGMVLIMALVLVAILALVGSIAVNTTTTDVIISGNYKKSVESFSAAEAGREEARARLRANAGPDLINDTLPTDPDWRAFVGSSANAASKGYNSGNTKHSLYSSVQSDLDYTVVIRHATDTSNNVLYWGDHDEDGVLTRNTSSHNGMNIYIVTSYGSSTGSNKVVETEVSRIPPVFAPGALYVESQTTVNGNSSYIFGDDDCGSDDKPGVATTLPDANVGSPPKPSVEQTGGSTIAGTPPINYDHPGISIQYYFDYFLQSVDYSYDVTDTGTSGNYSPGSIWGVPTGGSQGPTPAASSCSASNIVYFKAAGMTGNEVKLSGGVTGCGILLVDGNLEVNGGFNWYGLIVITGNLKFTGGGGGGKLVTGAIITKGSMLDTDVGGNTTILYCSGALEDQTENQPLLILSWREL